METVCLVFAGIEYCPRINGTSFFFHGVLKKQVAGWYLSAADGRW